METRLNREGIAVDDIHIYSNPFRHGDGATMGAPVTQNIPRRNRMDWSIYFSRQTRGICQLTGAGTTHG